MKRFICLFACVAILHTSLQAAPREWKSADGKFTIQAEFVSKTAEHVKLRKTDDKEIDVPISKLSPADQEFLKKLPLIPAEAKVPPEVAKILKAIEDQRDLEIMRLEQRIKKLEGDLKAGAKEAKNPLTDPGGVARLAANSLKILKARHAALKKKGLLAPRLSPKDLAVGQIGELDDDLLFGANLHPPDRAHITIVFQGYEYQTKFVPKPMWANSTTSRPDSFYLHSPEFVKMAPEREIQVGDKADVWLRSQVYEVTGKATIGNVQHLLLQPLDMAPLKKWQASQVKKKT